MCTKMSAFICSSKTFQEIYTGLEMARTSHCLTYNVLRNEINRALGGKTVKEYIDILYRLNVKAVNQRYNEKTIESIPATDLDTIATIDKNVSMAQFLKSCECLHYQMSEGDIPEKKEYKQLEKIIDAISYTIAHTQTEYENAHWD